MSSRSHHDLIVHVVRFTTTYAISAFHHWLKLRVWILIINLCDKSLSVTCDRSVVFSVFSGQSGFQKNWLPRYNWNIVESGVTHHNPNPSCQAFGCTNEKRKCEKSFFVIPDPTLVNTSTHCPWKTRESTAALETKWKKAHVSIKQAKSESSLTYGRSCKIWN